MNVTVRQTIKAVLLHLGLPVTRNLKYDIITRRIMKKWLRPGSVCIDIGCHRGEILDEILLFAPGGPHFAFEPIPSLYGFLEEKYKGKNIRIYPLALSDTTGTTRFNYVVNAPAYSGIRKRKYDIADAAVEELTVATDCLDNIVPPGQPISFIKIDVEGAEFLVFKGGLKTICRCRPLIIFEFGMGAADYYGTTPEDMFHLFCVECRMKISTLEGFLRQREPLDSAAFSGHFRNRTEYYFIAHP